MLGMISSPVYAPAIKYAAGELELILFEEVGEFKTEEFLDFCIKASQISLRYFVVDMDCTSKEAIIRGIRFFRLRSNARIILIAAGRKPGDAVVSTLVNLGVWDIVTPENSDTEEEAVEQVSTAVRNQMDLVYNYGNASRWHYLNDDSTFREEKQAKDRKSGIKILSIAGICMTVLGGTLGYFLFFDKGTTAPVQAAAASSSAVFDLTPIENPVSHFKVNGEAVAAAPQAHGKLVDGTLYMESSALQAFGVIESLELVIKAKPGSDKKDIFVYVDKEQPRVNLDGENISLEPAVTEEMKQGWIPVRSVLENAGYELVYNEEDHTVQLKSD